MNQPNSMYASTANFYTSFFKILTDGKDVKGIVQ